MECYGHLKSRCVCIENLRDVLKHLDINEQKWFAYSGCYFTSQEGLQSFTHPTKTLKPVPHVDSEGQICGSTFRVDSQQDLSEKKDNKENGGGLLAYF